MKNAIYILLLLSLVGCFRHSSFSEDNGKFEFSDVSEIRFLGYCGPVDTCAPMFYSLKDKKLIEECVREINEAKLDGPRKGAQWDVITIINKTDTIMLKSGGGYLGFKNSGTFYKLESKDFYKKYWGIN